uniref:Uncharacterized protein n=1 Tax=viral metagenome TaxID=1070528 RepID=A0A6C0KKA8_9ZZZZ
MAFLYVNDEETTAKINIDELYEKNQRRDLKQLSIFNKILNRIHRRITTTGRTKANEKHIWFTVPEYIFGEPVYDKSECIAYIVTKLEDNGFHVRYMHPNTLFVSWMHWVPAYVRNEIKKKTGNVVDQFGNLVKKKEDEDAADDMNANIFNNGKPVQKEQKQYTPIDQYKPSGNLVYKPEHFQKIEKKVSFV